MAQQDSDLPEGTDTIIPGATETGSTSGSSRGGSRSGGGSRSTSGGSALMDKVRSGSDKISEQAAGKARDFVGQETHS